MKPLSRKSSAAAPAPPFKRLRARTRCFPVEVLEARIAPASFADNGTTLNLVLNTAHASAAVVSTGTTVSITLTGDTWSGTNDANVTGNGTSTLTVTAAGVSSFTHLINLTDAAPGESVTFADSGANNYANNFGVHLDDPAAGQIAFSGHSGFGAHSLSASTTKNIVVNAGAGVSTTNGIVFSANEQATATSGNFVGVSIAGHVLAAGAGVLSISGRGGDDASGEHHGVMVLLGGVITGATTGATVISGTGGGGAGDDNLGVVVSGSGSQITSAGGAVQVTGTATGTGSNQGGIGDFGGMISSEIGVEVTSGAVISAGGLGNVTVLGTGGPGSGLLNHGVHVIGLGSTITSAGGAVSVTGFAGGAPGASFSVGVMVESHATIAAGGGGAVTVDGTGGGGGGTGGRNHGVYVTDAGSSITSSGSGNVSVTGHGGGSGSAFDNWGVEVLNAASVSAGTGGMVFVSGTGGTKNTVGDDGGVEVARGGATITSKGGAVSVTGQGGGSLGSADNLGLSIGDGGTISAGGSGTVTVIGRGGATSGGYDTGLDLAGGTIGELITSGGGAVSVAGYGGGTGASGGNRGLELFTGAKITAGGTGAVTVSGTGGATSGSGNYGVWMVNTVAGITSAGGDVSVTGAGAGIAAVDVEIGTSTSVSCGGKGRVSIFANSLDLFGGITAGAAGDQMVTLDVHTAGTDVDLGGADAPGTLGLTNAELGRISAGLLRIGDLAGHAHNITVTHAVTAPSGWHTLSLLTSSAGGTIGQDAGASLAVANLLAACAGPLTLPEAGNAVGTLAASAGGVSFTDSLALTVGSVDPAAETTIGAGFTGVLSHSADITLAADTMAFQDSVNAGTGAVQLEPVTAGRLIDVGLGITAGALNLSLVDLGHVTAGALRVGNSSSGALNLTAALTHPAGASTLTLLSGAAVSGISGSDLTVANLSVQAGGDISLLGAAHISGATTLGAGTHNVTLTNAANDFTNVTVTAAGVADLRDDTAFALTSANTSTLLVIESAGAVTQTGALAGTGGLEFKGGGTFTLSVNNTFSGTTEVDAGRLELTVAPGSSAPNLISASTLIDVHSGATLAALTAGAAAALPLASGQTLQGSGTVDGYVTVASGATLAPGEPTGLSFSHDLAFASLGTASFNLSASGGSVDHVTGSVSLGGATLALTAAGALPEHEIVLIANDGADPVTGSFANLPEGSPVILGGYHYRLTYHGGDGNDVTLLPGAGSIIAVSPGVDYPGHNPPATILVYNAATGQPMSYSGFNAYPGYRGSVRVAVADLNGDGVDDIITTVGTGSGRLRVFDGLTGHQLTTGPWAGEKAVFGARGHGAFVAAGDLNGDGVLDVVVGSGLGGGQVEIFDGATGQPVVHGLTPTLARSTTLIPTPFLTPFGAHFTGSVRVAVGDVNGDGLADLVVGEGYLGAQVIAWSGEHDLSQVGNKTLASFTAIGKNYRGGVNLTSGVVDSSGAAAIIVGSNVGAHATVEIHEVPPIFKLAAVTPVIPPPPPNTFPPFADLANYIGGVRVAATDVNGDGVADIICAGGFGAHSLVKIYDGVTHQEITGRRFEAFPNNPEVALFVAASPARLATVA